MLFDVSEVDGVIPCGGNKRNRFAKSLQVTNNTFDITTFQNPTSSVLFANASIFTNVACLAILVTYSFITKVSGTTEEENRPFRISHHQLPFLHNPQVL